MPRITECLAQRQEVAPEEVEEVNVNEKHNLYELGKKTNGSNKGFERREKTLLIRALHWPLYWPTLPRFPIKSQTHSSELKENELFLF